MFRLSEITQAVTGQKSGNDFVFSEAFVDSRSVTAGSLFIATKGEKVDGHLYVTKAFEQGAAAALIEEEAPDGVLCLDLRREPDGTFIPTVPFCIRVPNTIEALQNTARIHCESLPMTVIGITGSVGKTTTKELTAEVLSQHFNVLKTSGNMNNEIGLPLTVLKADEKTEVAVLEMGFYVPGEIKQLCDISHPTVGVITNVGMVHAERAGSMEIIARGKSELVQELNGSGVAILNYDDDHVRPMSEVTKAKVFYYGLDPKADLWADEVESFGLDGIRFCLHYKNEKHYLRIPLIGRHSVHTALRAAAVGKVMGMPWVEIFRGLNYGQSNLRMNVMRSAKGAMVIDDTYNASPESTLAALNLLNEMDGRKIAVLGDMLELGQYEVKGHIMAGLRAAEVCDELIAVGPASRKMAEAALSVGMKEKNIHWFAEVPEACEFVLSREYGEGDVLLVKASRSVRLERIIDALEAES